MLITFASFTRKGSAARTYRLQVMIVGEFDTHRPAIERSRSSGYVALIQRLQKPVALELIAGFGDEQLMALGLSPAMLYWATGQ